MVGASAFGLKCNHLLLALIKLLLYALLFLGLSNICLLRASTIYYHQDENGVMHFTDTPSSKEYKPLHYFGSEKGANKNKILRLIKKYSRIYDIDSNLVRAVLQVESSYNNKAISRAGAQGLMQIMPETQKKLRLFNPFDPEANIEAGARYLNKMLQRFSEVELALAAYNAGPSTVEEYEGLPPYPETRNYVKKVLRVYKKLKD